MARLRQMTDFFIWILSSGDKYQERGCVSCGQQFLARNWIIHGLYEEEFYDDFYHRLISLLIIDIISISLDLALMVILANNKRLFNVQQQQQYLVFPQTVFSFLSPMWLE